MKRSFINTKVKKTYSLKNHFWLKDKMKSFLSIFNLILVIVVVLTTTARAKKTTTKSSAKFNSVTTECLATFRAAALSQHNTLRAKHKAKAMTQDSTVDASALKWANYLASSNTFDHSKGSKFGENLYYQSGSSGLTMDLCKSKNKYLFLLITKKRILNKKILF